MPRGFAPKRPSFQAVSRAMALTAAAGGFAVPKLPRTAIPMLLVLKPRVWAPMTGLATPPARPS